MAAPIVAALAFFAPAPAVAAANPYFAVTEMCPVFARTTTGLGVTLTFKTPLRPVLGDEPAPIGVAVDRSAVRVRGRRIDGAVRPWKTLPSTSLNTGPSPSLMTFELTYKIAGEPNAIYQFDVDASRALHAVGPHPSPPGAHIEGDASCLPASPAASFVVTLPALAHPGVALKSLQDSFVGKIATALRAVPDQATPLKPGQQIAVRSVEGSFYGFAQRVVPNPSLVPATADLSPAIPWFGFGNGLLGVGADRDGVAPSIGMNFTSPGDLTYYLKPGDPAPSPAPSPSATPEDLMAERVNLTPTFEPAAATVAVFLDVHLHIAGGIVDPAQVDFEERRSGSSTDSWRHMTPLTGVPVTTKPQCNDECTVRIDYGTVPRVAGASYAFKYDVATAVAPLPGPTPPEFSERLYGLQHSCSGCIFLPHPVTTLFVGHFEEPDTELAALRREFVGHVVDVIGGEPAYFAHFTDPQHDGEELSRALDAGARVRVGKISRVGTVITSGGRTPANQFATDALEIDIPGADENIAGRHFYFASAAELKSYLRLER